MTTPNSGERTRAEMQQEIDQLHAQRTVDHALIESLQAEGVIDRDKIANLETALTSARRIGAAMGILVERHKFTEEQAFETLRDASQRAHRKLRDIAEELIRTGTIDVG